MPTRKLSQKTLDNDVPARHTGVFISYSGPLSRQVAERLKAVLEKALSVDIRLFPDEDGTPLVLELFAGLARSSFGICCMTKENSRSRWIHFEAGSLLRFVPAREMRPDRSPGITSRIVPFFYPEFPRRGDAKDNPLWAFKGKEASAKGVVEIVRDIARHLKVTRRLKDDKYVRRAWEKAEQRLRVWEESQTQQIRVGRFNPYHGDIIDHCTEIDKQQNDFRKFICDRLLRAMRDSVAELAHPRATTLFRDFHQFSALVTANLCKTTEILALCGSKPWGDDIVDNYYLRQYQWAKEQHKRYPRNAAQHWRVRRIFVRPEQTLIPKHNGALRAKGAGQRMNENRWIEQAITDHVHHTAFGVAAAILGEVEMRSAVPLLNRVWTNLVNDGFGFIALRQCEGWNIFAHMKKPVRPDRNEFLGVRFETRLVSSVVIDLFEDLWSRARLATASPLSGSRRLGSKAKRTVK